MFCLCTEGATHMCEYNLLWNLHNVLDVKTCQSKFYCFFFLQTHNRTLIQTHTSKTRRVFWNFMTARRSTCCLVANVSHVFFYKSLESGWTIERFKTHTTTQSSLFFENSDANWGWRWYRNEVLSQGTVSAQCEKENMNKSTNYICFGFSFEFHFNFYFKLWFDFLIQFRIFFSDSFSNSISDSFSHSIS